MVRVKIISCLSNSDWYTNYIGQWFDVDEISTRSKACHLVLTKHNKDIINDQVWGKIILKEDVITKEELRENKLKRICQ